MNTTARDDDRFDHQPFEFIANAIHQQGYVILPGGFDPAIATSLFTQLQALRKDDFRRAGVGRELDHHVNPFIRKDRICWLDANEPTLAGYFTWVESLRLYLNRHLFLGLFDYECHFASYPRGAFYKKHVDAFKGQSNRKLTTVLYLNPEWDARDGGELLLYRQGQSRPFEKVIPTFATMVIFLSEQFPHEVLPARKARYSLAGWYRINEPI